MEPVGLLSLLSPQEVGRAWRHIAHFFQRAFIPIPFQRRSAYKSTASIFEKGFGQCGRKTQWRNECLWVMPSVGQVGTGSAFPSLQVFLGNLPLFKLSCYLCDDVDTLITTLQWLPVTYVIACKLLTRTYECSVTFSPTSNSVDIPGDSVSLSFCLSYSFFLSCLPFPSLPGELLFILQNLTQALLTPLCMSLRHASSGSLPNVVQL